MKPETGNLKPETGKLKPETGDLRPEGGKMGAHSNSGFRFPVSSLTPSSIRDQNFHGLRWGLDRRRGEVYEAWVAHGPGTTRQVAEKSGLDLLALRPRTTELYQLGLLELVDRDRHEGVYQARTELGWQAWAEATRDGQMLLILCKAQPTDGCGCRWWATR